MRFELPLTAVLALSQLVGLQIRAEGTGDGQAEVVLRVLARIDKKPIEGATLVVPSETESTAEAARRAPLARSVRPTGPDGILRIGVLPRKATTLVVEAKGLRSATLNLPEGFEAGPRDVFLAPFQTLEIAVDGLDVRPDDARPAIQLLRCETEKDRCDPAKTGSRIVRRELGEDSVARIGPLPEGRYRAFLELWGVRGASEFVNVSGRSEDPDVARGNVQVLRRTFRGRVHLTDDTPVEATISAGLPFARGKPPDSEIGTTHSSPDGSFEISLLLPPGRKVTLMAESERPAGRGHWFERGPSLDPVDIVVHVGSVTAMLKERRTEAPIADCKVTAKFMSANGDTTYRMIQSDEKGRITFDGLGTGSVELVPRCKGLAAREPFRLDLAQEDAHEETIWLDKSDEILVRVADSRGAPLPGATIAGLDAMNSTRGFISFRKIGTSDPKGELKVPGEEWAGLPFWVYAPGFSLSASRFPVVGGCEGLEVCAAPVALAPPSPFYGLTVRDADGKVKSLAELQFWRDGIPIPGMLLAEAAGTSAVAPGEVLFAPQVLEPGDYEVRAVRVNAAGTGVDFPRAGFLHIPSWHPVELAVGTAHVRADTTTLLR
ncbi:MAG TPA: hypothetical protein VLJ18_05660 [Thermoanaerobaculia bacterium]|nr:hypothetical protein [Thermoanaerobaculia bacterium]